CFATSLDLYLLLSERHENPDDIETANGKPATQKDAHNRIARSLCCDTTELLRDEAVEIAEFLARQQQEQITQAVDQVLERMVEPPSVVLISGSAVFLADKVVRAHPKLSQLTVTNVAEIFDGAISESACAFAVARLAAERIRI
ncbi:MAG: hypothetical protein KDA77_00715, partial [Planctomycetaceae bacterium]|nr:hypothetical protein [Planctomycetaceae bacterium]